MARTDQNGLQGRARRGGGPGGPASYRAPGDGPGGGAGGGRYRRSVLEVAILASLAESTSHGYSLVDQIERLTAELVCNDPGSMYRLLRAMEQEGLVSSSWHTPEAGPSRRVYAVTERGIEALDLMGRSLAQKAAAMQELADHAARAVAKSRGAKN